MSVKYSIYNVPIETVSNLKDTQYSVYSVNDEWDHIVKSLREDEIMADTFNGMEEVSYEETYSSPLFTDKKFDDGDIRYRTINKVQFRRIIDRILEIINNYNSVQTITIDDSTGKCIINKRNGNYPLAGNGIKYSNDDVLRRMLHNVNSDNSLWAMPVETMNNGKEFHHFIETNIENKWVVTNSWNWRDAIFNFIHIYKMMDWDHNVIVLIAG